MARKPRPDLIDLPEYAAQLLHQKDLGIERLMPPPTISGLVVGKWTCEEMEMMRNNRRLAKAIHKFMKENDL